MPESFDAYHEWLGIAPKDQPPNHYQLLGIDLYESKANVIDSAADRQMAHLRTFQTGARGKLCQELLNQVSTARVLLLDAQKKAAYDEQIRTKLTKRAEPQPRVAAAIPLSQPAAHLAAVPKPARAAPPLPDAKPGGTAPLQAAESAPQFGGVSSRRRARRKQNTPWLAVGIGGAVLGVVVVIAALASMGDGKGNESANAAPAVRPAKSNSADPTKKPAASAVAKPSGNGERKPTGEPLPEKRPDEDDPAEKEPAEKDPPGDPPADSDNPFEIVDDEDPPADDGRRSVVTKRPAKPAVPSAAAREKAGAEIRKVFDIDAASDIAAKAKLARELLAAALDTADDPASQYVMLRMVRDTAASHGDYASAERTIGEMSQRFDVDVIAMRSAAVVQALAAKKIPPGHRKRNVRDALRVVQECHTADRYKHAKKSIAAALKAATSLRDKQLLADTRRLRDDGKVLAKQYEAVRGAFETLETKPDDPAANTSAGKYLCYVKGDWKRGLAMLAQGNDALLKDLATREQRGVSKLDEQIALADAWWKIADEQPSRNGGQLRTHAGLWYKKALPKLTGLDKVRVEKRLIEVKTLATEQSKVLTKRLLHPVDAVAFGGHWYKVVVVQSSWDDARQRCKKLGGYLACVETEAEAKAIASVIVRSGKISKYVWLGGYNDPRRGWQWINGRKMSFTCFLKGEPNNDPNRSKVRLGAATSGGWMDLYGNKDLRYVEGFVCEWDR